MQHEHLQNNWALVGAYRNASKKRNGDLVRGEKKRLMTEYGKTPNEFRRIVRRIKCADKAGVRLDLSDGRHVNEGRPSEFTAEIENAMKLINRANLQKKINTTRRIMREGLAKLQKPREGYARGKTGLCNY